MTINNAGLELIKEREGGPYLNAYRDSVGVWTIGYGNTFYENGTKVKAGDSVTMLRANQLFLNILSKFAAEVRAKIKSQVNDNQFAALVSFTYNVGIGNLNKSTLLKKVNANPNDPTIRAEFMKWNKAGGQVLRGLTIRRQMEANLYFYSSTSTTTTSTGTTTSTTKKKAFTIAAALISLYIFWIIYNRTT